MCQGAVRCSRPAGWVERTRAGQDLRSDARAAASRRGDPTWASVFPRVMEVDRTGTPTLPAWRDSRMPFSSAPGESGA